MTTLVDRNAPPSSPPVRNPRLRRQAAAAWFGEAAWRWVGDRPSS